MSDHPRELPPIMGINMCEPVADPYNYGTTTSADWVAYAHLDDIDDVFYHDALYVQGTAILVKGRTIIVRGTFAICSASFETRPYVYKTHKLYLSDDDCTRMRCTNCRRVMSYVQVTPTKAVHACAPCCVYYPEIVVGYAKSMKNGAERDEFLRKGLTSVWISEKNPFHVQLRELLFVMRAASRSVRDASDASEDILMPGREPTSLQTYDGMLASECLRRFELRQQTDVFDETTALSPLQLEAARTEWKEALYFRRKVAEMFPTTSAPKLSILVTIDPDDL